MKKTNKLMLLISFTFFLGCPLIEKPNNIKPSSSPTPVITTTPSPSASILDTQMSSNIKLEKFDGKLVFLSSEKPKDLEPNSLYFLDGEKPIPRKIFTFSINSNFNRFLISPDEKKVFILNVPLNQDTNTAPSSNNLDLYIFDLESNKLNKITLDKDIVLDRFSWFPNSSFFAIKDKSNIIYVFDIAKNQIIFENKFDGILNGKFILPEFKLIKESNFVYFWYYNYYNDQKWTLWKVYSDKIEKINDFKGYQFFMAPPYIINNSIVTLNSDYAGISNIDIESLKAINLLFYNTNKELNGLFDSRLIINLNNSSDFIIIAVFTTPSGTHIGDKLFLYDSINKKLSLISKEAVFVASLYPKMISKTQLLIPDKNKKIINIYTSEINKSLSDFFKDNLSYGSISSIYSN